MATIYTTGEIARMVGIHPITLLRWLYAGEIAEPPIRPGGGQKTRLWTARDLARVKRHKAKNYKKSRKLMRKKR